MIDVYPHSIPFTVGDCLFDSFSFALSVENIDVPATKLRRHVAKRAVSPEHEETRKFWAQMYESSDMKDDFQFAQPILEDNLRGLYENMMDATKYWGDDFALRMLSKKFRCRILIFHKHTVSVVNPCGPYPPTTLVLLRLLNSHYEPLELCDRFVQVI